MQDVSVIYCIYINVAVVCKNTFVVIEQCKGSRRNIAF